MELVDKSISDNGREDTYRRRLFAAAPCLCFGRCYIDGPGVCNGNGVGQCGCGWREKCKKLVDARLAAGVTKLDEDYRIPDDYDQSEIVPVPQEVLPAKRKGGGHVSPKDTTLSPTEQKDIETHILDLERTIIEETMENFLLLGREYMRAHSAMNNADFKVWTKKFGRDYTMAMRYIRWAEAADKMVESDRKRICNAPGITLEKFYAMVCAVGSDKVLELLDLQAKDAHGASVPITRLPVKELRRALAKQKNGGGVEEEPVVQQDEEPAAQEPGVLDGTINNGCVVVDDAQPASDGARNDNDQPFIPAERLARGPFNPLTVLQPMLNISRVWGCSRGDIENNLAKLDDDSMHILTAYLQFVRDVLAPDLDRIIALHDRVLKR